MACRLARIAMGQGLAYDTIASKVVTHRMRLLVWEVYSDRVYDEPASLKCPFQNALGKVSGSEAHVSHAFCLPSRHVGSTHFGTVEFTSRVSVGCGPRGAFSACRSASACSRTNFDP